MSDPTQPIAKIVPQAQTTAPFSVQNILCDDPVALCDDPVALCGGQSSAVPVFHIQTQSNAPSAKIISRR